MNQTAPAAAAFVEDTDFRKKTSACKATSEVTLAFRQGGKSSCWLRLEDGTFETKSSGDKSCQIKSSRKNKKLNNSSTDYTDFFKDCLAAVTCPTKRLYLL